MANIYTQSEAENYLRNQQRYQELKQTYADRSNTYLSNYNAGIGSVNEEYKTGKADIVNRFRSDLSQLGKSYSQQGAQLGRNFAQSMSEAFDSAQKQRSSFLSQSASIGSGQRQNIAGDLDVATTNAYDSYIQNYLRNRQQLDTTLKSDSETLDANRRSALSQLAANAQTAKENLAKEYNKLIEQDKKEIDEYEKEVAKEAENFVALANMPIEYLQYLWKNNPNLFNDDLLGRYTYLDENGARRLISREQMSSNFFDHDEDGNVFLSPAGRDFYSIVAYGLGDTGAALGFNDYMSENYNDLYQWATAANTYGDREFINRFGGNTNFDAVMGSLLGADIVANESYKAKSLDEDIYGPQINYDVGSQYNQNVSTKSVGSGDNINEVEVETRASPAGKSIESFLATEFYEDTVSDSDMGAVGSFVRDFFRPASAQPRNELFDYKYIADGGVDDFVVKMGDSDYKFRATNTNADSTILDDVTKAYGSITEKKIYKYDGIYYMGVKTSNGDMVLRKLKLKGKDTKDALKPKD